MFDVQVEVYQNILQLKSWSLTFTHFQKTKRGQGLVSVPHFLYGFWEKYLSSYILLTDQISSSGCLFFLRHWIMCFVIISCLVCHVIDPEIDHNFLVKPFFKLTQNSGQKMLISQERKQLLIWNKTHFSSFLKGFQCSELPQTRE